MHLASITMNYSAAWARSSLTKHIASFYLQKYGHLLNWKPFKENVLEIGCADASITKTILLPYVKKNVQKLVAVDKLEKMIDFAKSRHTDEKIEFQTMDIMDRKNVDKFDSRFDHIFSLMVSHWIPDTKSYFKNLRQMLREDGQIFLVQLTNDHPMYHSFQRQLSEGVWSKYLPTEPVFGEYTDKPVQHITELAKDVGFEVINCNSHRHNWIEEEFEDFVVTLLHMYDHLDQIPMEKRQDFYDYHIRNCCERYPYVGEPKKYEITCETLVCIASKV